MLIMDSISPSCCQSSSSSSLIRAFPSRCDPDGIVNTHFLRSTICCHRLHQPLHTRVPSSCTLPLANSRSSCHRFPSSQKARACYNATGLENEEVEVEKNSISGAVSFRTTELLDVTGLNDSEVEGHGTVYGSRNELSPVISKDLARIYEQCKYWTWRDQKINYVAVGSGPAIVLVHGFGASIGHWRRNIGVLSLYNTVYALDLLGFGDSSKPIAFEYTMETWGQLLLDFVRIVVAAPTILVGNSVGSLACLIASAEALDTVIRGLVLLNCAGGMNNKAVTDDWRLILATPILWIVDFLLKQRNVASYLFNQLKSKENLKAVLQSVYANKDAVDDELVEIIMRPAEDYGALDAFVSIVTGPPGPTPMSLMTSIRNPVLILWGDNDPFTPIDGPVGKYFCALPSSSSNVSLHLLPNVGHCPHDEQPELVNEKILAWIATLPYSIR
ncbi:hypothetical protein O6H91_16G067600 [Diphasiastrum complanatum]|uniref:Uncharacterized protein n=2 Tax=Diphasiastrum complanatum TaxID=34168 RepID=A0ACC2BD76_DIPCM|nr:hypothetical protein O6H91_16G051600 [Diphasiastrum complanatum]KAJ7527705.1 hypothetical protein O6H91_16G067600 [Diphasiastrum complanatum]